MTTTKKRILGTALLVTIILRGLFLLIPAQAATTTDNSLIGRLSPDCSQDGDCNFCDILDGFMILTRWILGICGIVALIMFVRFGFMFVISSGESGTIANAKKGLVGTVFGLLIVFAAWEVVNLTLYAIITPATSNNQGLQNPTTLKNVILFGTTGSGHPWYEYCAKRPTQPGRIPGVTE